MAVTVTAIVATDDDHPAVDDVCSIVRAAKPSVAKMIRPTAMSTT